MLKVVVLRQPICLPAFRILTETHSMPPVLQARDLRKHFGSLTAVDGVSFQVEAGSNARTAGTQWRRQDHHGFHDHRFAAARFGPSIDRRQASERVTPTRPSRTSASCRRNWPCTTNSRPQENLELFGSLYGLTRNASGSKPWNEPSTWCNSPIAAKIASITYSGGMKRRLNLAAALLHDPRILLLDEPTVGVDPQSRNAIFDNLEELKRQGKAIVYTTHYMEEVERMCDRVVIIDHGKVIAEDTCEGLYRMLPGANVLQLQLENESLPEGLRSVAGVEWCEQDGLMLRAGLSDLNASGAVLAWLTATRLPLPASDV